MVKKKDKKELEDIADEKAEQAKENLKILKDKDLLITILKELEKNVVSNEAIC